MPKYYTSENAFHFEVLKFSKIIFVSWKLPTLRKPHNSMVWRPLESSSRLRGKRELEFRLKLFVGQAKPYKITFLQRPLRKNPKERRKTLTNRTANQTKRQLKRNELLQIVFWIYKGIYFEWFSIFSE